MEDTERDTAQTKVPASRALCSLQPTTASGPSAQKGTRKGRQPEGRLQIKWFDLMDLAAHFLYVEHTGL